MRSYGKMDGMDMVRDLDELGGHRLGHPGVMLERMPGSAWGSFAIQHDLPPRLPWLGVGINLAFVGYSGPGSGSFLQPLAHCPGGVHYQPPLPPFSIVPGCVRDQVDPSPHDTVLLA